MPFVPRQAAQGIDARGAVALAQAAGQFVAIHVGQQDIDQHRLRRERAGLRQGIFASAGAARFQSGQGQEFGQQFRAHFVVVYQQDA